MENKIFVDANEYALLLRESEMLHTAQRLCEFGKYYASAELRLVLGLAPERKEVENAEL